jgi:hypothetical protein
MSIRSYSSVPASITPNALTEVGDTDFVLAPKAPIRAVCWYEKPPSDGFQVFIYITLSSKLTLLTSVLHLRGGRGEEAAQQGASVEKVQDVTGETAIEERSVSLEVGVHHSSSCTSSLTLSHLATDIVKQLNNVPSPAKVLLQQGTCHFSE